MDNKQDKNEILELKAFQRGLNSTFSLKELLFKYLSYLPFILLIFSISVGLGYVYIRYTEPIYKASIQMLVKFEETKSSGGEQNDLIIRALRESKQLNIDNEITKIKSVTLLKQVVEQGGFNIKIRNIGRFRSSTLYHDSPIAFDVLSVKDSTVSFSLDFSNFLKDKALLSPKASAESGLPKELAYEKPYQHYGVTFVIRKTRPFDLFNEPVSFVYEPSIQTARRIVGAMSVSAVGKTSILQIDLKDDNPVRAKEILNTLVRVFKMQDVEAKRIASQNTIAFIDERLIQVGGEIDSTEAQIMGLRKKLAFNDVESTTGYFKNKLIASEEANSRFEVQLEILKMLEEYFQKPEAEARVVPTDLGIDNGFLSLALREYNDLQLRYEREKAQLVNNQDNKFLADYRLRIKELKYNIQEILKNVRKETTKRIELNNSRNNINRQELSVLPELEKKLKNIQVQGTIKRELYLYLLKRKEEIAITSATFLSSYEAIDAANASNFPVEPRVDNIRNFSILIGLIIPIIIIYLIDLFNDKVTLREQILKKLSLPIAGEVSHVPNPTKFVFSQSRSLVAEQFRILRTNLGFLFRGNPDQKVILISSTISGEGKSFVSSNLAAAISVMDKKVALLLFDLRKASFTPVISELLKGRDSRGITNYLIGQTDDFSSLGIVDEAYPNLHIYASGPIPPNPAELLLSNKMSVLFEKLRKEYDYVIVDSAPAGLVSDAFILQQYVDLTLYIIRQQFTLLKQLEFIRELSDTEKLKNLSIVVNDVTMGGRYGYYGYNYGYGYSYSYQYGYGYKYNKNNNSGGYYTDMVGEVKQPWWAKLIRFFKKR